MGSGGAPEGVITAAAIRCLNGYMLGRLVVEARTQEERLAKMGIKDKNQNLRSRGPCSRQATHLRRHRSHRRRPAERRPLLRRRHADLVRDPDPTHRQSALHRKHPPGEGAGCEGEVRVEIAYLNSFNTSAGTFGSGGKSCENPLNSATVFSERRVPSCTEIVCGLPGS